MSEITTTPTKETKPNASTPKAKKSNYKVTACFNHGVPGSIPTPIGFNWHQFISFNVESATFPKKLDLLKKAIQQGAKPNGLDIVAVFELPSKNWDKLTEKQLKSLEPKEA